MILVKDKEDVKEFIRVKYGKVASSRDSAGGCCDATGCGCGNQGDTMDISSKIGYTKDDLTDVPSGANMGLGCGNPIMMAGLKAGETVLDLGSGGGLDCFLARKQVGESGHVIGIDMTPEMLTLARKNAQKGDYTNVEFRLGEIEHLPVANESVDVIISNCVINLSLDKAQVFKEAYRVLKPGGRLAISDVVATAPLPQQVKEDLASIAGCIGGAEYVENIKSMLQNAGFKDIKLTPKDNTREIIKAWTPDKNMEDYVASYIIKAVKDKEIGDDEARCGSYSQEPSCCY